SADSRRLLSWASSLLIAAPTAARVTQKSCATLLCECPQHTSACMHICRALACPRFLVGASSSLARSPSAWRRAAMHVWMFAAHGGPVNLRDRVPDAYRVSFVLIAPSEIESEGSVDPLSRCVFC